MYVEEIFTSNPAFSEPGLILAGLVTASPRFSAEASTVEGWATVGTAGGTDHC